MESNLSNQEELSNTCSHISEERISEFCLNTVGSLTSSAASAELMLARVLLGVDDQGSATDEEAVSTWC